MPTELIYEPESVHDIAEAYQWYENYRLGLGEEFLDSIDLCVQ